MQGGGATFSKDQAFTMGLTDAIMSMATDPKSKTLAVATGSGSVYFMAPKDEGEWNAVNDMGKSHFEKQAIALSVDVLQRGQSIFVVGFSNGMVRLFKCDNG